MITQTQIANVPGTDLAALTQLQSLSAVSPDAALCRPLDELVRSALKAAARSSHSKRAYATSIGLFLQFLDRERGELVPAPLALSARPFAAVRPNGRQTEWIFKGPAAVLRLVDAGLVDSFRAWRESEGDKPNTATVRVYATRSFLAVAYRDGVLTTEQAQALGVKAYHQRQDRDEQPVGRRLSPAEVRVLRDACDESTNKRKRDVAIMDAMLYLGLRREEVANLQLNAFHQDGGRWWLVITGKGKKTRRLKVHDALFKSLSTWLEAAGLKLGTAGWFFQTVNKGDRIIGQPLDAGGLTRLIAEYGHGSSLAPLDGPNRLSPHDLRRTCARNAYDNGANLLLVQAMLGHSDPKTTARYIGAFEQDDNTAVDYVRY